MRCAFHDAACHRQPDHRVVKNANKQPSTIVALTMVDQVQDDDVDELIVQRVLQQNKEGLDSFAACIGVANRKHTNRITLQEAHTHDQQVSCKIHTIASISHDISGKLGIMPA